MSNSVIPAKTLKSGTRLERALQFTREAVNVEARTVDLAFASELPYERWWGVEILDVAPTSVRLGRLKAGAPLLWNHNTDRQIGVVESVSIGADRVGRAVVRFGKGAEADEIFADVADGIRRNVSVGYQIHQAVLVKSEGQPDEGDTTDTYRVTDWEPYEVSIVSVPADPSVGIGRSGEDPRVMPDRPAPQALAQANPTHSPLESRMQTAAPEVIPAPQATAPAAPALNISQDASKIVREERARAAELTAIGDKFARFGGVELAKKAIEAGETVDSLRAKVMNAMTAAQTELPTQLDLSKKDERRFSVMKAIHALVNKDWSNAAFERECSKEICKRAGLPEPVHGGFYVPLEILQRDLTVGTPTAGGNLVATNLMPQNFIDLLRARSVVAGLGATMMTGLVGNVAIPKLTGAATAYWLANEATAITESQQTIGQLAMSPKTVGAYTEVSRLLMLQSTPSADALVMNDFAKVIALAVDLAALEGSGASGQPTGISLTAGIGSVTGTTLGLAGVIEFQSDLAAGNALTTGCAYVTTPAVAALLAQRARIASTDSVTLWRGNILDGQVEGFRATTTTQVTAASMVFGDFSQVVIGEWGMFELAMNPYANFSAAITGIRAIQSLDIGIRQAAAFSRATSIT